MRQTLPQAVDADPGLSGAGSPSNPQTVRSSPGIPTERWVVRSTAVSSGAPHLCDPSGQHPEAPDGGEPFGVLDQEQVEQSLVRVCRQVAQRLVVGTVHEPSREVVELLQEPDCLVADETGRSGLAGRQGKMLADVTDRARVVGMAEPVSSAQPVYTAAIGRRGQFACIRGVGAAEGDIYCAVIIELRGQGEDALGQRLYLPAE